MKKKMKKNLLTESQIRRMATIAGIPALGGIVGRLAEKLDIQAEQEEVEETPEEVVNEQEEEMDMVLAAIEAETGVPAERVDSEEEMPAEEPEMDMEPEMEMDAEEPEMDMDAEEEMMETTTPTLAERIAQAVQSVIDEDAAVVEGYDMDEEEVEETDDEKQLDEITKAVVARLRSLK